MDDATQAWSLELAHWGLCGQGTDEKEALESFRSRAWEAYRAFLVRHGEDCPSVIDVEVAERIHGDELAFQADRRSASDAEVSRTVQLLDWARADLLELLGSATEAELDWDDPEREMPAWASWRTARLMAWHIADTETRYYLASLGLEAPPRSRDVLEELERSADHVRESLASLPGDLVVERGREVWTSRKVLRRLAWHERGEVDAMRSLLGRARDRA